MSVFISVISHGHGKLIKELSCLKNLAQKNTVVVKLNVEESDLIPYLIKYNIQYIDSNYNLGFGHNNNIVYSYCKKKLSMNDDDAFVVFNPDIIAEASEINKLFENMTKNDIKISTINLFKDDKLSIPDYSVRNFPSLFQFISSFIGFGNSSILDKSLLLKPTIVDWASGSFIAFRASHYKRLNGFDEGYFMYCEDIDICYRSHLLGEPVTFYPDIKGQHLAKHANRSIFSKHFYWHVSSVFRFMLTKIKLTTPKSSI